MTFLQEKPVLASRPTVAFKIRPATQDDCDDMGKIQVNCWKEAPHIIGYPSYEAVKHFHSWSARANRMRERLRMNGRLGSPILLAEHGGRIAGFCASMRGEGDVVPPGYAMTIDSLYLRPEARGCGIGEALLRAMIGSLRERTALPAFGQVEARETGVLRLHAKVGMCELERLEDGPYTWAITGIRG